MFLNLIKFKKIKTYNKMKLLFLTITSYFMFTPLTSSLSYNNWKRHQNNFTQELSNEKAYDENFMYMAYSNTDYKHWKLTVNKFSGFHPDTFDLYYKGYNPQSDLSRSNFNELVHPPKSLDWRNSTIVGHVKDQEQCDSCWAFSAVSALESQVMKVTQKSVSLSEQDMVDCVKNVGDIGCCDGCMGGEMYAVYQYLLQNQNGTDDTEKQYPYMAVDQDCSAVPSVVNEVKINDFVSLPVGDEDAMQKALYHVGPLSVGVDANQDWQLYHKGIYNPTAEQCSSDPADQDHGVAVVGYGSENGLDYWIVRNSWGEHWGEDGYMRLARGNNACGVANSVIYPIVEKTLAQNQCLNSHLECPSEVCYTHCPCSCFIPSNVSPCLCSAATCSC
jgi:C1A family cysteine protease